MALCNANKTYKLFVNILTSFGSGVGGYSIYDYPEPPTVPPGLAAFFSSISGSTIQLSSEIPNLLDTSGSFIQFDVFRTTGVVDTVFGNTTSSNGILLSSDNLQIVSGTTTGQLDFNSSLSTGWHTIRVINDGSTLATYLDNSLQTDTQSVMGLSLDLIGKNTPRYGDVRGVQLNDLINGDYLYKNNPDVNLYGDGEDFWRAGSFFLEGSGDRCVMDCMNGASGWRVDVVNTFFSYHRLRFLVGDGTTVYSKYDDTLLTDNSWVHWYVDLTTVTGLSSGEIGFTGNYATETSLLNVGYNRESGYNFGGKMDTLIGGTGTLTTAQQDWFFNDGTGRVIDEFTTNSTVSSGLLSYAYELSEITGTRYDSFGVNHLTESPYSVIASPDNASTFDSWSAPDDVDGWSDGANYIDPPNFLVQESGIVYQGDYAAKIVTLDGGERNFLRRTDFNILDNVEYTATIWAAFTGANITTGVSQFSIRYWGGTAVDFVINNTGFTEYSYTFEKTNADYVQLNASDAAQSASIFDNFEVKASHVYSVDGLRTSFTRKDTFDGYLKNVRFYTSLYENGYNLYENALDTGNELNHGVTSNIDFVTTNPDPSGN